MYRKQLFTNHEFSASWQKSIKHITDWLITLHNVIAEVSPTTKLIQDFLLLFMSQA